VCHATKALVHSALSRHLAGGVPQAQHETCHQTLYIQLSSTVCRYHDIAHRVNPVHPVRLMGAYCGKQTCITKPCATTTSLRIAPQQSIGIKTDSGSEYWHQDRLRLRVLASRPTQAQSIGISTDSGSEYWHQDRLRLRSSPANMAPKGLLSPAAQSSASQARKQARKPIPSKQARPTQTSPASHP
jgi:hypothetical protein